MMRLDVNESSFLAKLISFKAMAVGRGILSEDISAVEYRVPEYTYAIHVPITLEGAKSEDAKRLDEMLSGLSEDDRRAWNSPPTGCLNFDEKTLEDRVPLEIRRKIEAAKTGEPHLSPAEQAQLKQITEDLFGQQMDNCLRQEGMSERGREHVGKFVRDGMRQGLKSLQPSPEP